MSSLLSKILSLPLDPPGSLAYHLILTFSLAWALLLAVIHRQRNSLPHSGRMVFGLGALLALRLALLLYALAALGGLADERLLPPLDRAFTLLSLILIIWLWAFPRPVRLADAAVILLALSALTVIALALVWWSAQGPDLPYNGSWLDRTGEVFMLAILAGGLLALFLRRPSGWNFGLGMLLIMAAGHLAHLVWLPSGGDYSPTVRLAQLAAFPFLLFLPQRFPPSLAGQPAPLQPAVQERRRFGADPQLVQTFLTLFVETDSNRICTGLVQAVAHTLLADIVLLVSPPGEDGQIVLHCGYDLVRQEGISPTSFPGQGVPVIVSVVQQGRSTRLPPSSTSPDLLTLASQLHLNRPGNFMAAPVAAPSGEVLAGLVLLSSYSGRAWEPEDEQVLNDLAGPLALLWQRSIRLGDLHAAQTELDAARQDRAELMEELAAIQEHLKEERLQTESLTALINAQEEARQSADKILAETQQFLLVASRSAASLQTENERLRLEAGQEQAARAMEARPVDGELRLALEEVARLRQALDELDRPASAAGGREAGQPNAEQLQAVASLAEDLRKPLNSVINYTDFLLDESVGPLAALQRKFLERIKNTTRRAAGLVDDLVHRISPGISSPGEKPADLGEVIGEALTQSEHLLREKNLALSVDLPERLPAVPVDRAVLRKVFLKLLQAVVRTIPPAGQIGLRALIQPNGVVGGENLLIQVSDSGLAFSPSGPPPQIPDQPGRENLASIGLGEADAELADLKSAVESLAGQFWVEGRPGHGAVLSVLLPVATLPSFPLSGQPGGGPE